MNTLCTINNDSENLLVIEKSKFFAYSFKISSESEVQQKLAFLKQKYPDATHICYAYDVDSKQKCSDDGEPQGTAGKPILDCLQKKKLKNVLVCVVRYFSGIKLGAGGLVRAYSTSASKVLVESGIKELCLCQNITFEVNYEEFALIEQVLKSEYVKTYSKQFLENVKLFLIIDKDYQKQFTSLIENKLSRKVDFDFQSEIYYWELVLIKEKYGTLFYWKRT